MLPIKTLLKLLPMSQSLNSGLCLCLSLAITLPLMADDPEPVAREFSIEKLSPALDELLSADAELDLLGDRYGLTEGPLWVDDDAGGHLLFTDLISNAIFKWTESEGTSVFLDEAGYSGDDINNAGFQARRGRMRVILIGPNGLTADPQGRPVWCAMPDRRVMRLEPDGSRTVLAETYQGKRFSGPNDLVFRSDGILYFTDSIFGLRGAESGQQSPYREIPYNGVFMVIAIFFNVMWLYAARKQWLMEEGIDLELVGIINRQYRFGPVYYLVALLAALVSVPLSISINIILALFFALPAEVVRRIL